MGDCQNRWHAADHNIEFCNTMKGRFYLKTNRDWDKSELLVLPITRFSESICALLIKHLFVLEVIQLVLVVIGNHFQLAKFGGDNIGIGQVAIGDYLPNTIML